MTNQYEVERPQGVCARTGEPIAEGDEFYSVLFEEGDTFRRADYSIAAWDGPPENAYCFFRTRLPVKEKRRRTLVDDAMLRAFFARLADEKDLARVQFRFVIALILMRKRQIRYLGSNTKDGVETWTMKLTGEDKLHLVTNPRLTEDEIADVSRQLSAIMHSDMGQWALEDDADDIADPSIADPSIADPSHEVPDADADTPREPVIEQAPTPDEGSPDDGQTGTGR